MAGDEWFFSELWVQELRPWFLHLLSDFVKTLSILGVLYVIWEVVNLLRIRGYPPDLLSNIEKTHFAFMWIALVSTSFNFVIKQVIVLWRKRKP